MKIHKSIGSKERFLEMFQGVNKIQMNEVAMNAVQNGSQLVERAFEELTTKVAQVKQTNTQVVDEDNFVEIVTVDNDGNQITFTFKVNSSEGDQDGVYNIDNAALTKFKVVSQNFNVDWDENMKFVQEFNANHASEIMNVVAEFANFETDSSSVDEVYEDAVKLIDKVPYKKSTETMQTSKAYGDQKPTNSKLRVHATELDKFVSEMEDYVNNANAEEEKDVLDLPPEYSADDLPKNDDDGSIGVDPYDQAIADAEAGNNDWKIEKRPEKTAERTRAIPSWAEAFMENKGVVADMDTDNMISHGFENTLSPEVKEEMIRVANDILEVKLGVKKFEIPKEQYIKMVKDLAIQLYQKSAAEMNEESEKNDYPDQIGKKFKPKNQFPKKKKKPQSVVKLSEENNEYGANVIGNGNNLETGVEQIEVDKEEEVGNELEGGLGDDKSPSDFCPKQLAMGLEVEMEHTDDPKVALEIAIDHLTEMPDYYTRLNDMEADVEKNGAGSTDPTNPSGCLPPNMQHSMTGVDSEETDELLGYKPHNVNDYSNEEFDYAGAEREYSDKEGYNDNADNKDNDIPENFWKEFQALVDEYGEKVVNYLFNNGLRGYYETMVNGKFSFDEVRRTIEMLKVPEVNEVDVVNSDGYQGDVGDRYQDGEGNQLTVRDTENNDGGVSLQGQGGEKEIATSDIQFLKKLGEEKVVEKEIITEEQIKTARLVLKNRGISDGMTKKEAVQTLIKHNIK